MKNRMLPLGYGVKDGIIVKDENEIQTVMSIFNHYCNGYSLKKIAEELNLQNAVFKDNAPPWNKSRILHILTDKRYIGAKGYPQAIDMEIFNKASAIKENKSVHRETTSQEVKCLIEKTVCGKCGSKFNRSKSHSAEEKWVCQKGCRFHWRPTDGQILNAVNIVVNKVAEDYDLLMPTATELGYKQTPEIMRLTNEMLRLNEQAMPSFNTGKKLIFQIASKKFSACREDKSVYTDYVANQLGRVKEHGAIDADFLRNAVNKIIITGKNELAVEFVNGATVMNREEKLCRQNL